MIEYYKGESTTKVVAFISKGEVFQVAQNYLVYLNNPVTKDHPIYRPEDHPYLEKNDGTTVIRSPNDPRCEPMLHGATSHWTSTSRLFNESFSYTDPVQGFGATIPPKLSFPDDIELLQFKINDIIVNEKSYDLQSAKIGLLNLMDTIDIPTGIVPWREYRNKLVELSRQ